MTQFTDANVNLRDGKNLNYLQVFEIHNVHLHTLCSQLDKLWFFWAHQRIVVINVFVSSLCVALYVFMKKLQSCHILNTVYPKKYAHGFCFAVLCCGYTLTDFPISIRLTSLALWQSNDCPSASKATLMNMDKYFMWIHYERLHNHNKAKHNKTVCIFLGIYCRVPPTRGHFC